MGITNINSIKVAGPIPAAPTGLVTRVVFAEWVGRLIPWLRLWSKELANAVIERRDITRPSARQPWLGSMHGMN